MSLKTQVKILELEARIEAVEAAFVDAIAEKTMAKITGNNAAKVSGNIAGNKNPKNQKTLHLNG